jgi:hypothetical protein
MEMARKVKLPYDFVTGEPINIEKLEAFAALVSADERELCAKVCDDNYFSFVAADKIRARGQA